MTITFSTARGTFGIRGERDLRGRRNVRGPVVAVLAAGGLAAAAVLGATPASAARHTERVSVSASGAQSDGNSEQVAVSADGRYVAFTSLATNLVPGDTDGTPDVFERDLKTGAVQRVSVTSAGGQSAGYPDTPVISADGRYVAFDSDATGLVAGDTNGSPDIFVHDRRTGATTRVSLGTDGAQGNESSYGASISADGRYVAFTSSATNLVPGDTDGQSDVFVRDRRRGTTVRVSVGADGGQEGAGLYSYQPAISGNGRYVAFASFATNLVPGDTNSTSDIFVHDVRRGTNVRVSVGPHGAQSTGGVKQFGSLRPSISADGRVVAFDSYASGLTAERSANQGDTYVHNLGTGVTQRVAVGPGDVQGDTDGGQNPQVSADGRYVVFQTFAGNLVAGDTNGVEDVFVRDLRRQTTTRASLGAAGQGDDFSMLPSVSRGAKRVAFVSGATNLVPADTNGFDDIFIR